MDIVIVRAHPGEPFERRALAFDASSLPVPADVLVYSAAEWEAKAGSRAAREAVWVYSR